MVVTAAISAVVLHESHVAELGASVAGDTLLAPIAQPVAAVQPPAAPEYGNPISFLRAPVAVDAVKNEAVIARAVANAPPAAPPATRSSVPSAANAAESSPLSPRATPAPATARSILSPDQTSLGNAAYQDPSGQSGATNGVPAQAAPSPSPQPTPAPTPAPPVLLRMHTVKPGESLTSIGAQYGVSVESLLANNLLIQNGDQLKIGLQIAVPGKEGVLYFVNYGDTLSEIAAVHGVETDDIIAYQPNELPNADAVRDGQLILVPGGARPRPTPAPTPEPTPTPPPTPAPTPTPPPAPAPSNAPGSPAQPAPTARPAATPAPTAAPRPASSSGGFIWPITGRISSYFGPSHPLGIDIDLYGRAGTPIVAARGGTVAFAGGNPCCSYGYYVDIDHGDGYKTRYAHFQAPPPVRIGQRVEQGQVVGYAGTTGYSTGVHLHFEILRGGAPVNPLGMLPR
ncbi:MAG: peptidoglycan DD-metalloendopeptidase family protein [Dehalococcoidia bacterium]